VVIHAIVHDGPTEALTCLPGEWPPKGCCTHPSSPERHIGAESIQDEKSSSVSFSSRASVQRFRCGREAPHGKCGRPSLVSHTRHRAGRPRSDVKYAMACRCKPRQQLLRPLEPKVPIDDRKAHDIVHTGRNAPHGSVAVALGSALRRALRSQAQHPIDRKQVRYLSGRIDRAAAAKASS